MWFAPCLLVICLTPGAGGHIGMPGMFDWHGKEKEQSPTNRRTCFASRLYVSSSCDFSECSLGQNQNHTGHNWNRKTDTLHWAVRFSLEWELCPISLNTKLEGVSLEKLEYASNWKCMYDIRFHHSIIFLGTKCAFKFKMISKMDDYRVPLWHMPS